MGAGCVYGKAALEINPGGAFLGDGTALGVKEAALGLAGYKSVVCLWPSYRWLCDSVSPPFQ